MPVLGLAGKDIWGAVLGVAGEDIWIAVLALAGEDIWRSWAQRAEWRVGLLSK